MFVEGSVASDLLGFFCLFPPNNRINYLQNKRKKILNAPENHLLQKKEFLY